MKKTWLTYAGATLGVCALLNLSPVQVNANENQSVPAEASTEKDALVEISIDEAIIAEDIEVEVLKEETSVSGPAAAESEVVDVTIGDTIVTDHK